MSRYESAHPPLQSTLPSLRSRLFITRLPPLTPGRAPTQCSLFTNRIRPLLSLSTPDPTLDSRDPPPLHSSPSITPLEDRLSTTYYRIDRWNWNEPKKFQRGFVRYLSRIDAYLFGRVRAPE